MPEETAGYVIAIIRVGEYRLYLNHMFGAAGGEYCTYLKEIGTVEDIKPATTTGIRNPGFVADKGYTFKGWYNNPEFTGEPITKTDASWSSTVHLYGKWEAAATE
jgi:uncharacterized repeat protein (TIGR02543 family)